MTNRKFFAGCEAGCIGHDRNGYPIRDYQLVLVKEEEEWDRVLQVRQVWGVIGEDGEFHEAKPECRSVSICSSCEPEYELVYWVDGAKVPNETLVTQYEVIDISGIADAISNFVALHPDTESPYFFTSKFRQLFSGMPRQLDGRKKEDKAIIDAIKKEVYAY